MSEIPLYDPHWVANYFDAYGVNEWNRLVRSPVDEIRLAVHQHYLDAHLEYTDRVLEVGAGAGRFTRAIALRADKVHVVDISPVQLDFNRKMAVEHGFMFGIEDWSCLDMCEMPKFEDESFDAVVCYGGPLSYVFERKDDALREMRRVLRKGGRLFASVMSLWGSIHEHLPGVLATPVDANAAIIATGNLHPGISDFTSHRCHLFRAEEFRSLLECHAFEIETLSASNCLAGIWGDRIAGFRQDPSRWQELIKMEIEACQTPGCLDMGTHLIGVATKR